MYLADFARWYKQDFEIFLELYMWLGFLALIGFLGFRLCGSLHLIRKASNFFLLGMAGALILFFYFAVAEIYYYLSHGNFIALKTQQFKTKRDRSLADYDTARDVIELEPDILKHAKIKKSKNAKYVLDPNLKKINLNSIDGKDAYVEFSVSKQNLRSSFLYQPMFSVLVEGASEGSTHISAFEHQHISTKSESATINGRQNLIPVIKEDPSSVPMKEKDDIYLIKRELDLPSDQVWRYVQDFGYTVLQRRFHMDLRFVEFVDIVFRDDVTESDLKNFRCNFRIAHTEASKTLKVIDHQKLASGFNLIDLTNQVLEIQGEKVIRFNVGSLVRNAYRDRKKVFLEELIMFFPGKADEVVSKRPVKLITFNKSKETRRLIPTDFMDVTLKDFKKNNTLDLIKRELGFSIVPRWRYHQNKKFTVFNRVLHKDLHSVGAMEFSLKRGVRVPNKLYCQIKVGFYENRPSETINCDNLSKKILEIDGQVFLKIQLNDLVQKYYAQGKKRVFLEELKFYLEGSVDYYVEKQLLQGIRFFMFSDDSEQNLKKLIFVADRNKENFSWCDVRCSRDGNHILAIFFKKLSIIEGTLIDRTFVFRLYTSGAETTFRFPRLANVRIYPPHYNYETKSLDSKSFQHSRNKFFVDTVNRKKDDSKIRIIFFGASETYGYGTGWNNTYPNAFKGIINLWADGPKGKKFDIINMGIVGNTTFGWLYQYDLTDVSYRDPTWGRFAYLKYPSFFSEFTVKDLKPDIAILSVSITDLLSESDWKRISFGGLTKSPFTNLVSKLSKVSFFHNNALGYYIYRALDYYSFSNNENINYVGFEERLDLLIKKLRDDGVRPILISIPLIYHALEKINVRLMKKLANKHEIPFYHLRSDNKNLLRKEYWYDGNHPSAAGYNDVASNLFNRIIKDSSLSDLIVSKLPKKVVAD